MSNTRGRRLTLDPELEPEEEEGGLLDPLLLLPPVEVELLEGELLVGGLEVVGGAILSRFCAGIRVPLNSVAGHAAAKSMAARTNRTRILFVV